MKCTRESARFRMIPRPSPSSAFGNNHASEHEAKTIMLELSVQQQSGRWT
jgi:hypothetical protein